MLQCFDRPTDHLLYEYRYIYSYIIINQKFNLFFTRPLPLSGHVVRPNSSWFPINQMFWWTLPAIAAPAEVATFVVYVVKFDMENGTFSICSFAPSVDAPKYWNYRPINTSIYRFVYISSNHFFVVFDTQLFCSIWYFVVSFFLSLFLNALNSRFHTIQHSAKRKIIYKYVL